MCIAKLGADISQGRSQDPDMRIPFQKSTAAQTCWDLVADELCHPRGDDKSAEHAEIY